VLLPASRRWPASDRASGPKLNPVNKSLREQSAIVWGVWIQAHNATFANASQSVRYRTLHRKFAAGLRQAGLHGRGLSSDSHAPGNIGTATVYRSANPGRFERCLLNRLRSNVGQNTFGAGGFAFIIRVHHDHPEHP
jgi:hypothetical protein